jgi:hypothetical protein
MMDGHNGHRLLPKVREHETNRELVWQVELPATDRVRVSLDGRLLTVNVRHDVSEHPDWRVHPDAAAV